MTVYNAGRDVDALMTALHKGALVRLSRSSAKPLQGIHQGTRALKHALSDTMRKKLLNIEAASGIVRTLLKRNLRSSSVHSTLSWPPRMIFIQRLHVIH